MPTFKDILKVSFMQVYPPDGVDYINKKINGMSFGSDKNEVANIKINFYLYNPTINNIRSFFGLPNYYSSINEQKWSDVGKSLIGWQSSKTLGKKIWNSIKALPILILNLIRVILTTGINSIKLGTEFLPRLFADLCKQGRKTAWNDYKEGSNRPVNLILAVISGIGQFIGEGLFFIGQAITSPAKNLRHAINISNEAAKQIARGSLKNVSSTRNGIASLIAFSLSLPLTLLSIAITVTSYAFIWPLAIKALSPIIMTKAPVVVSQAWSWLGQAIAPVVTKLFIQAGIIIEPTMGAAALVGFGLPIVGAGIHQINYRIKNWYNSRNNEQALKKSGNLWPRSDSDYQSSPISKTKVQFNPQLKQLYSINEMHSEYEITTKEPNIKQANRIVDDSVSRKVVITQQGLFKGVKSKSDTSLNIASNQSLNKGI